MSGRFDRRRFLRRGGVLAVAGVAGCTGRDAADTPGPGSNDEETKREHPNTIFVDTDGGQTASGTADDPLDSIQAALSAAAPGDTIHAKPGEYTSHVEIRDGEGGESGDPITITGPTDAVLKGGVDDRSPPMRIESSHVHLKGMSIDGLIDPDHPDDPMSYALSPLVHIRPPRDSDEYLEDLVIAPHVMGNAYAHMVVAQRTRDAEIGPFRVTGLAGANYVLDEDATEKHVGEIVYLGTPPSAYEKDHYPWEEIDQTREIHVHHIDNSEGHPHSELVNTKLGTRNVLVEYCTDGGGSQNAEPWPEASIRFQGQDATLRWNDLRDGLENGVILVGGGRGWLRERYEERLGDEAEWPVDPEAIGTGHKVYGNRISGFGGTAMKLQHSAPDDNLICANEISGNILTHNQEEYRQKESCPARLPDSDGLGHTGGDTR